MNSINKFFKIKLYLFYYLILFNSFQLMAAAAHTWEEGIKAFEVGNFRLACEIIDEYIGTPGVQGLKSKIYDFAMSEDFSVSPPDTVIKAIVTGNEEDPFYKILIGRLHLLGLHPESNPARGLRYIEERHEEKYAAYTLGLFYEGKFGHIKRLQKASEWYEVAGQQSFHVAIEKLAEVNVILSRGIDSEAEWDEEEWEMERHEGSGVRLISVEAIEISKEENENECESNTSSISETEENISAVPGLSASDSRGKDVEKPLILEFKDLKKIDRYRDVRAIKIGNMLNAKKELIKKALTNLSLLEKLVYLDLSVCFLNKEHFEILPTLRRLEYLNLSFSKIGIAEVEHISKLTNLVSLILAGSNIGIEGLVSLTNLVGLRQLGLSYCHINDVGAEYVSKLVNVVMLNLDYNTIRDNGAAHLSKLAGLTTLNLRHNTIGDNGAAHLSKLAGLTTLDLSHNTIGDNGAAHLSKLAGLTTLDLSHNTIGNEGARHLSKLAGLTTLDLSHNTIGNEGARHLSKLAGLTTLDLSHNTIGDEGARYLSKLVGLTTLDLSHNTIGNEGARHLSKLAGLTTLSLSYNNIGNTGTAHLSTLVNLTALDLNHNYIRAKGPEYLLNLVGLYKLNLSHNPLGTPFLRFIPAEGAIILSKLSPKIKELILFENNFGPASLKLLAEHAFVDEKAEPATAETKLAYEGSALASTNNTETTLPSAASHFTTTETKMDTDTVDTSYQGKIGASTYEFKITEPSREEAELTNYIIGNETIEELKAKAAGLSVNLYVWRQEAETTNLVLLGESITNPSAAATTVHMLHTEDNKFVYLKAIS